MHVLHCSIDVAIAQLRQAVDDGVSDAALSFDQPALQHALAIEAEVGRALAFDTGEPESLLPSHAATTDVDEELQVLGDLTGAKYGVLVLELRPASNTGARSRDVFTATLGVDGLEEPRVHRVFHVVFLFR